MGKVFLLLILTVLGSSCFNAGDCLVTASGFARIDFYDRSTKQLRPFLFNTIEVAGLDAPINSDTTTSSLLLPVNPLSDTTRFTLNYSGRTDFITFQYSSETRIISPDCGAFVYVKNLEIVNTSFDPTLIKLVSSQLLRDPVHQAYLTNVQIYF